MIWLDVSFARQLGPRFARWKEVSTNPFRAQLRCPICGDSQKSKRKARGWVYQHAGSDHLTYGCFNCNVSMSFEKFLKQQDFNMHERYVLEKYRNGVQPEKRESVLDCVAPPETKNYIPNILESLTAVGDLSLEHPVRKYIESRCIPTEFYNKIYYAPKFFEWTREHTDKFANVKEDHPRLIVPWISKDGVAFGYSARAFGREEPKYYTIHVDDTYPLFFGLDRTDTSKNVYVVEGAIDAMFLDNAVAVGTSALYRFSMAENITYIPDRDVRNPQIMQVVKKLIDTGKKVCMLPESFKKDINDAAKDGMSKKEIMELIDSNSYSGLEAQLYFSQWRKCK